MIPANSDRKFRHEYKVFITYADYLILKSRIKAVAKLDLNTDGSGEYSIRSLYFDNIYDSALREKIDGVNNREKFRIRIYNGSSDFIRLEKKSKINGLCNKISAPLTRAETEKIISGDIEWMKDSGRGLVIELYSKMKSKLLRPKVLVDYIREPYVYAPGNVRITFDRNLKTGLSRKDIFNQSVPTVHTPNCSILLEVKYDEFLPSVIRDIIQIENRSSGAFSKYCSCRAYG